MLIKIHFYEKLILGVALVAMTGGAILVACSKQDVKPNPAQPAISKTDGKKEHQSGTEKSGRLTDADLIDIIQGLNPSYTVLEEIEDLLLSNCQLSSSALRAMIADAR